MYLRSRAKCSPCKRAERASIYSTVEDGCEVFVWAVFVVFVCRGSGVGRKGPGGKGLIQSKYGGRNVQNFVDEARCMSDDKYQDRRKWWRWPEVWSTPHCLVDGSARRTGTGCGTSASSLHIACQLRNTGLDSCDSGFDSYILVSTSFFTQV